MVSLNEQRKQKQTGSGNLNTDLHAPQITVQYTQTM